MQTITKYLIITFLSLYVYNVSAQDSIPKSKEASVETLKEGIKTEEREALKLEVEAINKRVLDKEITYEQAEDLKEAAAKKRALNIENRLAILENNIELHERNNPDFNIHNPINRKKVKFGVTVGDEDSFTGVSFSKKEDVKRKYDRKTYSHLVFAIGMNNAVIDGVEFGKSPYYFGESGFVELGLALNTRLLKESNAVRLKYGFSFQWNKYDLKDNKYFVENGNLTSLESFPLDLKEAEFRITNLVFPLHFEFGPSNKVEKEDYFRYNIDRKFKIGIGAYAGFNIGTQQKIRYDQDGDRIKEKIKRDYNATGFVYGVSTYVGLGNSSLYLKYDLSETFDKQPVKQNNISLGIRFDFD
ncbi:hypothetical protein [Lacinutrix chionoecetis]